MPDIRSPRLLTHFASDVFWWEPDGRVVALSSGDGLYFMSCIHPSGTHAVFWGGSSGRPRLWTGDGAGGLDAVTGPQRSARYPSYNVRGDRLVYCRSDHESETIERLQEGPTSAHPHSSATLAIVVRDVDGGRERQLTDGAHRDERPALSPDGSRVVFVSDRAPAGLWLVDVEGEAGPRPLLADRRAYRPWWSVDGERIYFFKVGPRHQVHVIAASGGLPTPLSNDDRGNTHGPYADPDGLHLIVHSTRGGDKGPSGLARWALYELPLDGGPPRRLAPPGHDRGAHGTRARNGVMTFDVSRPRS